MVPNDPQLCRWTTDDQGTSAADLIIGLWQPAGYDRSFRELVEFDTGSQTKQLHSTALSQVDINSSHSFLPHLHVNAGKYNILVSITYMEYLSTNHVATYVVFLGTILSRKHHTHPHPHFWGTYPQTSTCLGLLNQGPGTISSRKTPPVNLSMMIVSQGVRFAHGCIGFNVQCPTRMAL